MSDVNEAKVDKGRSDYGKASIRNYRRSGPGHGDPGMFDPSGKRGKTIDKRREEHKARRGVKGAKVPAYKVESAAGYSMGGEIKKGIKRHKDAVKKKKERSGKAVPYAMLAQEYVPEEGYDHMRDRALEKGTWKEPERKNPPRKPMTKKELDKQAKNSQKALDIVKGNIRKKYGKGAIMGEENLSELKNSTLLSYSQKATNDLAFKGDGKKKARKRATGIKTATNKLAMRATDPDGSLGYNKNPKNEEVQVEAKVDLKTPEHKRATVRDKRYGNPHGSHELGGGIRKDRRADHEARRGVKKEEVISERQKDSDGQRLSLERGRSNYGKASVRNMRASGTGGNAADPAERLVAMDARHKAHKEKRGVKKEEAVQEAAWQNKEGKSKTGGLNEKGRKSYERENPGSDLKAPQPKGGPRKRSFCARMGGVKGPMMKDGKPTRKKLALDKWKCNEEVKMTKKAYNKLHKDFKSDDPKNPRTTKYVPGKGTVSMPVKFVEEGSMATANKNVGASKCWTGYKRMGTQKKNGKTVPKCVKAGKISLGDFLREGNPTSRMLSKSKSQVTGNISADRGTDEKKNKASRKGLEKDLKKKGIGYKKGVGEYKYKSDDGKEGTGREVSYQTSPGKGMSKRRFGKLTRRLGRKHGQESVITKDKNKPARLHDTQSKKPGKSINIGKSKPGKSKTGDGETSGTKVRSGKLQKKTNKPSYHYG